jgi:hypothetical protein
MQLRVLLIELTPDLPPQPKKQKAQSLEDILLSLGLITSVSYEPFQAEPKQVARAVLPLSSIPIRLF